MQTATIANTQAFNFSNLPEMNLTLSKPKPTPKPTILVEITSDKQSLQESTVFVAFLKSEATRFRKKPVAIMETRTIVKLAKAAREQIESLLKVLDKSYLLGGEVKFDKYANGLFTNMHKSITLIDDIIILLSAIVDTHTIRRRLKTEGKDYTFEEFKKRIQLA